MIYRFADPLYLLLFAAVPLLVYWYVIRGRQQGIQLRF